MEHMEPGVYSEEAFLHFYDCDYRKHAKLSTLLKLFAELAGADYTHKGLSHEHLWEEGLVFLLSRVSMRLHRIPQHQERLRMETWEHGKQGALFMRFARMFDEQGVAVVDFKTAWLLCNPETRRIVRPSHFAEAQMQREDKDVDAAEPGRIAFECTDENRVGAREVRYSDIDANGHVYNAVYGDMASDFALPAVFDGTVTDFAINFVSEAKLGDVIDIHRGDDKGVCTLCGEENGRRCFEAQIVYRPVAQAGGH